MIEMEEGRISILVSAAVDRLAWVTGAVEALRATGFGAGAAAA
jgi:hypothetical protein